MSQNKCKHSLTFLICISLFVIFSGCGTSKDDLSGHWKVTDTKMNTSYDIYLTGDSFTQVFNGVETTFSYKIVNNGKENLRMELNNEDGNITYLDLAYKNKDRTVIEASTDLKEGKYSEKLTEAIANMESLGMDTVSKANWNYIDDKQKP
ncbi:hypothetical protein FRY98_20870 [Paenibacillus faecis]|uniref:Lipocalin-like domain-containing protein n=1 Tax=Paenibacillus faecis TaxID=862114 RepID=A0A5D0CNU8_9BACL|nr:hypothetical protein [Paenibacillus faecis]TYA11581.1 hypothetical protein FRY98_20870 [Paenibacillus faecis]